MPSISVTVAVTEIDGKSGEVIEESRFTTSREVFERRFSGTEPMLMAIEVDTYSPWVSRILERCGHEALVANAKKVSLVYGEGHKTYKIYAEKLARFGLKLLSPIIRVGARTPAVSVPTQRPFSFREEPAGSREVAILKSASPSTETN